MVIKGEKATEVTLADGPILATELADVLRTAWSDDERFLSNYVSIDWQDGHKATVRELGDLQAIEDAENIGSIHGQFRYSDGSELSLSILSYYKNVMTAKGSTARSKQSEIAQLWTALPHRARLHSSIATGLWWFGLFLICFVIYGIGHTHLVTHSPVTLTDWIITASIFVVGAASLVFARSTQTMRARRHPVIYHRKQKDKQHFWGVVAVVVGTGSLVVAMLAWLYPRN